MRNAIVPGFKAYRNPRIYSQVSLDFGVFVDREITRFIGFCRHFPNDGDPIRRN